KRLTHFFCIIERSFKVALFDRNRWHHHSEIASPPYQLIPFINRPKRAVKSNKFDLPDTDHFKNHPYKIDLL
ncbi:hypothetical protein, partial [Arenibacter sp. F20364]|uniref:hypothetical protein n=1 Tax=Arenibacter sp. F20364 TaxID=2926415 RepID=UPI001FF6F4AA